MWKKQIGLAAFVGILAIMQLSAMVIAEGPVDNQQQSVSAGVGETAAVWLVYDGNMMPNYGDEITVYIHSDANLFIMDTIVAVSGDANITSAMNEADCNNFGWENGWDSNPYIDTAGWVDIFGISLGSFFNGTAINGTVGYLKFRYYGGQVSVSITADSTIYDSAVQPVLFSTEPLIFGSDPNQSLILGGTPIDSNSANAIPSQDVNDPNNQIAPTELPVLGVTATNNTGIFVSQDINDSNISTYPLPPFAPDPNKSKPILIHAKDCELIDSGYAGIVKTGAINNLANNLPLGGTDIMIGSGFSFDSGLSVIEIYNDVTTNQIWTANNIYHINVPINVQALLVIEPGTQIIFGDDNGYYDCAIYVNNGGTLISTGTPDNPIIYTSDSSAPDFADYYCPIYIEETASHSTKVTYSYFEYAYAGILIDNNRLDSPIENNYFYYNTYGILEVGTALTDIQNNLFYYSDNAAIDVNMASDTGQGSADTSVLITNNTCDSYQTFGIIVRGVANSGDAGQAKLLNNIVSRSYYYGLALVNGSMYYTLTNTGYYNNPTGPTGGNTYDTYIETRPVIETTMPYLTGTGTLPYFYLKTSSAFVNASDQYIEQTRLIGKTADINSLPDTNKTDVGFHYPNWDYSNAGDANGLTMDLNADLIVNFKDFAVLAAGWQVTYDIGDLNVMADEWLNLADPNIQIQISGDSNNGYVDVGVSGYLSDTRRIFIFTNGKYIGEVCRFKDGGTLAIDISGFGNEQQFKAISINIAGHITCSNIKIVTFSNPLTYCVLPERYVQSQPLYFAGIHNGTGDVSVSVYANGGNLVWSQTYSGNNIFGSIPAEITNQYDFDYVSFTEVSTGSSAPGLHTLSGASGGASVSVITDPEDPPWSAVTALIILPDWGIRFRDYRTIADVKKSFRDRGVLYAVLWGASATYDNVADFGWNGRNIKYMFIDAHGDYQIYGVLRTLVWLYDGPVISVTNSDFPAGQAPSWCTDLGLLEGIFKSFYSMGFTHLEFVFSNACWGGHLKINSNNQLVEGVRGEIYDFDAPQSDMSIAFGMGDASKSRFYQGWYDELWTNVFWDTDYQEWDRLEWMKLGEGENLYWALQYVISQQTNFGPEAPVNNYILRGQGSWMDIELRNW